MSGIIRYLLEKDQIQHEYVRAYTNASLIVKDGFGFEDGLFTGYDEEKRAYDKSSWDYDKDDQGFAKIDDTWQNPHCVINLLRKHVDRYTPRNGVAHLRHAAGEISADLRAVRVRAPRRTKR